MQGDPTDTKITTVINLTKADGAPGVPFLVQLYGPSKGRRYALESGEVVLGRSEDADIEIDQEGVSRRHACIDMEAGKAVLNDLESTNGTFVNDERIVRSELTNGDLIHIGQTIFKFLAGSDLESRYHEEIYRLTTTDALTNASNKRHFVEHLDSELNRARRYGRLLALVMFDIDHFKAVNDTHGHLAGDHVLREMSAIVKENLRTEDFFARYGGEEFAIILPEIDAEQASNVCEKLRGLIEAHEFEYEEREIPVTVSLGIRNYDGSTDDSDEVTAESLIGDADVMLYRAKGGGRNRVCA